jgi:hypothetical protein
MTSDEYESPQPLKEGISLFLNDDLSSLSIDNMSVLEFCMHAFPVMIPNLQETIVM